MNDLGRMQAMQTSLNRQDYQAMALRELACWAQGARCGHIDGKARAGVYLQGEELSIDIALQPCYRNRFDRTCWEGGYCDGYRLGASGEALPSQIIEWPLPEAYDIP